MTDARSLLGSGAVIVQQGYAKEDNESGGCGLVTRRSWTVYNDAKQAEDSLNSVVGRAV